MGGDRYRCFGTRGKRASHCEPRIGGIFDLLRSLAFDQATRAFLCCWCLRFSILAPKSRVSLKLFEVNAFVRLLEPGSAACVLVGLREVLG